MTGTGRVAVILFPGVNCEEETARACVFAGMDADIVRWNAAGDLSRYDGFVLPGGWSYEDRIRAGAIASKDEVMKTIREEASAGKPVLGICNGAQVLVESGMIPGLKEAGGFALAPNINRFVSGYYCTWVHVRNVAGKGRCAFTGLMERNEFIPIPIAHGEGRFATIDGDVLDKVEEGGQAVFRYCDGNGKVSEGFPVNPNGSLRNIAGICNPEGNILAMMPHPERCAWNRQLPGFERRFFSEMKSPGPGMRIFRSMEAYIAKRRREGGN